MKEHNPAVSAVIVSIVDDGDSSIMLVGKKRPGKDAEIINAFSGKVAIDMWDILTSRKESQ